MMLFDLFNRLKKTAVRTVLVSVLALSFCALTGCDGENFFVDPLDNGGVTAVTKVPVNNVTEGAKATPTADAGKQPSTEPTATLTPSNTPTDTPTPTPTQITEVRIVMAGDMLIHDSIEAVCKTDDGSYDYNAIFDHTRDIISAADLAIANQEIIIGGKELGISGYPSFNCDYTLADALENAGFDVVCHATNHALDKGKKGIVNCLTNWRKHENIGVTGIYDNKEDSEKILIVERNGVKIAILNFTYGTNGVKTPEGMPWAVSMLNESAVIEQLDKAEMIADITIVCPHWGTEYTFDLTSQQKNYAKLFYEHGADLVLGTHSHVLQPVSVFTEEGEKQWTSEGTELKPGEMLCFYSLGNFVSWSNEIGKGVANRFLGMIADVTIRKNDDGKFYVADFGAIPVVSHVTSEKNGVTVIPLYEYTGEMALKSEMRTQDSTYTIQYLDSVCNKILGDLWKKYGTPDLSSASAIKQDISVTASDGRSTSKLKDDSYKSVVTADSSVSLEISAELPLYGLYVEWNAFPPEWTIEYDGKSIECGKNGFLHEFVEIPGGAESCVMRFSGDVKISDITGFTAGLLPGDIQVWEPALEDPDILVFSTHADDEILFLGSVLVTYGGELKKKVQVIYMCEFFSTASEREHEKLDGLWTAGIRNYPVNGPFSDTNGTTLSEAEKKYGYDNVAAFATENIRRFKPQVVVTQDFKGEYGHGGHIVLAEGVKRAVENSMNADYDPESSEKYGVWDVPKTYFHLYPENEIFISVREPLENMGGRIGLDILADAYRKHESQQWCWFYVSDGLGDHPDYKYSVSKFGLYRTTVGLDTGNDMLEHTTAE